MNHLRERIVKRRVQAGIIQKEREQERKKERERVRIKKKERKRVD